MTTPVIGIRLVLDGKEYKVGLQGATADTQKFGSQAEQSFARVTRDANAATVSVGQMNAALRQVPAQFTDIVTSLAGGQNPLTVLLQQGGQLKDSFGGVGAAAKALGGYVAGLVNPFTIAAAAGAALTAAYVAGQQESDALRKSVILTGGAIGATAGQLQDVARGVAGLVGTQGAASEAIAALASTGRVQLGTLSLAAEVAVRAQRDLGVGVEETAKQFAELAGDPVKASLKLNETTNYLTVSVYKQIKALEDQGKTSDAARLAQDAYANAMNQRLGEIERGLGTLERAWKGIKDAAKAGWDAMLNVGRPDTLQQQLDAAQSRLEQLQRKAVGESRVGLNLGRAGDISAAQQVVDNLQRQISLEGQIASQKAAQNESDKAQMRWREEGDKYLSKELQMRKEIERIQNEGKAAGASDAEIQSRVSAVRDKFADKTAINAANRELENQKKLVAELAGLTPSFAEDWARLNRVYDQGKLSTQQLTEAQAALLAKQPFAREQTQEAAKAAREAAKAEDERAKVLKAAEDAQAATIRGLITETEKQNLANQAIGLSRTELDQLHIKRLEDALATREQTLAQAELYGAGEERLAQIRSEIAATQQLISAKRDGARLTAEDEADKKAAKRREDAARDALRDGERLRDTLDRAVTDGLMRGFENGKGLAENFRDSLAAAFKTTVLRPVISFVMAPVTSALGSVLGGAPGASFLSGGGSFSAGSSLLTSAPGGSIGNAVSGLGSLFGSAGTSAFGAGMGLSGSQAAEAAGAYRSAGMNDVASQIQAGQIAGAAAGYAAGIGVGITAGNAVSGGYGSRSVVNIGTALGAAVGGPVGAAIGGTLAGIANRTFGSKAQETTAVGFEGSFSTAGFSGRQFADWRKQGGWLARDRSGRDFSELTAQQAKLLNGATDPTAYMRLAGLAGVDGAAGRMDGWKFDVNRAIGSDADMAKLIADVSGSLGSQLLPELKQFQADGEALAATAVRLGDEFAATNDLLMVLGETSVEAFNAIGLASTDAREAIIAAAGGLDTFKTATQTYFSRFFTSEEQRAMLGKQLASQFAELNLAMPTTRQEFRSLVESLDLTTESGQKALGSLLALSGSVDQYVTATEANAASIASAADQLAKSMKSVSDSLRKTIADVMGAQSPEANLQSLMGRFDTAYAGALTSTGESLAGYAQQINDTIGPLLDAAREYYATGADYQRIFNYVTGGATTVAGRIDGSHAGGLQSVPFDGYVAQLHAGEAVVDAQSTAALRRYFGASGGGGREQVEQLQALVSLLSASQAAMLEQLAGMRTDLAQTGRYLQRQLASA
jgi:phage-related minor tail protein